MCVRRCGDEAWDRKSVKSARTCAAQPAGGARGREGRRACPDGRDNPNATADRSHRPAETGGSTFPGLVSGVGTRVDGNNVVQTNSVASSQGFSISSGYPLAPNTGTAATVDRGANLSSLCSGALAGLCADTTAAVKLDPVGNKVVVNRVTLQRPATGAWDVGAFEFDANGGGSTPLNPPTNLRIAN